MVNEKEIKKMTLKEFQKFVDEEEYNVVKEYCQERFPIFCGECNSQDLEILFRSESGRMGSEYTGYMHGFNHNAGLLIKCKKCGNAMDVRVPDL